jgi:hypothetical protein
VPLNAALDDTNLIWTIGGAPSGRPAIIETSTNLVDWSLLAIKFFDANGLLTLPLPLAEPALATFYRTRRIGFFLDLQQGKTP